MSVTFRADTPSTIVGYAASCYAYGGSHFRSSTHATREQALEQHEIDHADTADCDFDGHCSPVWDTDADPELNLSNANASRVLELLEPGDEFGDIDLVGSMDADAFLGAVMIALALTPADAGVPATSHRSAEGAMFVDCGRPEGYLQAKLGQLLAVGEFAKSRGARVTWG